MRGFAGVRDKATVEAVVREALEAVRSEGDAIERDGALGLDSTQAMELIMQIEDRLDISIPVETLADARTFDQLCAGILRL
jgi:acyl carrier protein